MRGQAEIEKTEQQIGVLLTWGTWASSGVLALGLVASLVLHEDRVASWLLAAGLIVLMATPMARVAASIVGFFRQRDWPFVVYTSIVFLLLIGSVIAAFS